MSNSKFETTAGHGLNDMPTRTIGAALGISHGGVQKLIHAGLTDRQPAAVQRLADRRLLTRLETAHGPVPILRLGDPRMDGGRRVGFHVDYTDLEVLEATRQWWTSQPRVLEAGALLAVIGSVPVAWLDIDGIADEMNGQFAFDAVLVARVTDGAGTVRVVAPDSPNLTLAAAALKTRALTPGGGNFALQLKAD